MITLLTGKKGSGKTKKLIDLANKAVETSKGNVVVIEKGLKLTYDVSHQARLIDVDAYGVAGLDSMIGFVSGICAGNYDVTDILIDSTLKVIGSENADIEALVTRFEALSESTTTNIVLSLSAADEDLPESFAKYLAK